MLQRIPYALAITRNPLRVLPSLHMRLPSRTPARLYRPTTPVMMGRRSAKIATRKVWQLMTGLTTQTSSPQTAQDAAKAKLYGKLGKLIVKTAKAGGPDPVANVALADVLRQARDAQVPKDIIERNIKKASEANQADFQELLFEAYGPGGTGFLIECLSDNVNRSASEVRAAVTKSGGKMAEQGSVAFNFKRQGVVLLEGAGLTEDQVYDAAMEAGADDVQAVDDEDPPAFRLLSSVEDFATVRNAAQGLSLPINTERSGLVYTPLVEADVDDETMETNSAMLDRILAIDDVDAVYTTCAGLQ